MADSVQIKKGVLDLIIGEIFLLISAIGTSLSRSAAFFGYLSILSIPALILFIVGIVRLRAKNAKFNVAFWLMIACLILTVIGITLSAIIKDSQIVTIIVACVGALGTVLQIGSMVMVIEGLTDFCGNDPVRVQFGKLTEIIFIVGVLISAVITLLGNVGVLANLPEGIVNMLSFVSTGVSTVAYVFYLIHLVRTYQGLE